MRNLTLYAAGSLILAANLVALVHAARNRGGQSSEEITFTQHELFYFKNADDSGIWLSLRPEGLFPQWYGLSASVVDLPGYWLDQNKVCTLGFDCSVAANAPNSVEFYRRKIPRAVFVAMELVDSNSQLQNAKRLVAFDAARDRDTLRSRYRDRHSVIVVPAVAQVSVFEKDGARRARLYGTVTQIPTAIHIPKPFSEPFQNLPKGSKPTFRVHVKYGALSEPWVTAVEVDPLPKP